MLINNSQFTQPKQFSPWIAALALIIIGLGILPSAQAQSRYIIDDLQVNLRSGAGNQFRILQPLHSGAKLELLEVSDDGNWSQVRTEGGSEGWVPTQYIGDQPIARDQLAEAQRNLARINTQRNSLQSENDELKKSNLDLTQQLNATQQQASESSSELGEIKRIASNSIELNTRHQRLLREHESLQTELDVANAKIDRLSGDSRQTWFLYGAIAVVIGVILTLIIQGVKARRRYSEWA